MTRVRKTASKPKSKPQKPAKAGRLSRQNRRKPKSQRLEWRGTVVAVSYDPDWLGMSERMPEAQRAHLEVRKVSPEWALLPITETGYRSHFLTPGTVENAGGPIAYVRAWLDEAAKAPDWKRREQQSRQLSLF